MTAEQQSISENMLRCHEHLHMAMTLADELESLSEKNLPLPVAKTNELQRCVQIADCAALAVNELNCGHKLPQRG